ncbi:MAG: hypothetical protein KA964_11905 [Comamonas sp.]|nr:hypothetical protein [Comamonas sp.]
MRGGMIDFSSWSSILTTVASLLLITLLMVGIRLVFMQTIQKRRERENRQINERLKTLMAAYKTLGGSFTGELAVSPVHLRDVHAAARRAETMADAAEAEDSDDIPTSSSSERQRRTRDSVEAALSDVILLGTEEQVRLAAQAAQDMVAGRAIETAPLVASLRQFIRAALDLEPIPAHITIPNQGPTRSSTSGGNARRATGAPGSAGAAAGGGRAGGGGGGAAAGGMGGMGVGMGLGGLHKESGSETE